MAIILILLKYHIRSITVIGLYNKCEQYKSSNVDDNLYDVVEQLHDHFVVYFNLCILICPLIRVTLCQ